MKLFRGLNSKVLSIDFGSSEINIVEGQSVKGIVNISEFSSIQVSSDLYEDGKVLDNDKLSETIIEGIKQHKISKDLQSNALINSSLIITREVTIPMVSEAEIESIIEFQLSEFLPINPDDYVVNHLVIGTIMETVEKLRILLVAIPKGIVLSHLSLMKECDLKPKVLDFHPNAISKLLNFSNTLNGNYSLTGRTIACVDLGHMSTAVSIVRDGNIEVTRTFDIGANNIYKSLSELFNLSLDQAQEKVQNIEDISIKNEEFDDYHRILNLTRSSLESLIGNVESVIRYYTSRDQKNRVDLILLYGGLSNLNGISEMFSSYLQLETTKLGTLDKVKFNGDLSLYANAIGGLLSREEVKR